MGKKTGQKAHAALWLVVVLAFGASAQAGPIGSIQGVPAAGSQSRSSVPIDGTWIVLDELMTEGAFFSPLFTYTSATSVQLDVTDLFVVSDRNEVYVDGVLFGTTPAMPDWQSLFPAVGPLDPPYTSDPAVAWTTPEFSKQSFILPAGTHLLTFRDIHIPLDEVGDAFADGTVAFRLVPEPSTAALLLLAIGIPFRRRRNARDRRSIVRNVMRSNIAAVFTLAFVSLAATVVRAGTPCGPIEADVVGNTLEIVGTSGNDDFRVAIGAGSPFLVEIFNPATSGTASCSFDSVVTPFSTIHVAAGDGDDQIVFDDSNGAVSDSYVIVIDGGAGEDVVLGGIDLNAVSLNDALNMIASLQQAQTLIGRVLDLLDESNVGCSTVPCLVTNAAGVIESAGSDLVIPTANYVRDIESELVQPSAQAVRDAHDRIANYLQTFVATDAQNLSADAQTMTANVEVMVDEIDLLLPVASSLLVRAQTLYDHASSLGLNTQSGDSIGAFTQTIENHILTISELSDLCAEDPEPTETEFDEDLQDPSGLSPFCAELERRIEALEVITDSVETSVDGVEAEGDAFEADGDQLEIDADAVGDDETPSSNAAMIEAEGDQLVLTADALSATADAMNADWEAWVAQEEADLESRGATMDGRGQTEVLAAANTLENQAEADIAAAADAIRAEAEQMEADLQALMLVAAPLLADNVSRAGNAGCEVTPTNTILGGPGNDILIGTTGSDRLEGGDDADLLVGAGGADQLFGDDGNDLLFGGGGNDELHGGAKVDVIIGNKGDDCLFGGGGQTLTQGSLSVDLGDIFFGSDGNDNIVSGESVDDALTEIDFAMGGDGSDSIRLSHGGTLTVGSFSFQFGNLAFGGAGDDEIVTRDGVDVLFGGDDNDAIDAGKGYLLTIGSGSSAFRLALGDLIFGGNGDDELHGDDPDADRADDDIDVIFGRAGEDTIHGYGGGLLSVGDVNNPDFELRLGNLIFGGDQNDEIDTLDGIDVIFGGNDDDSVIAGKGDVLTIGSGSNEFRLALGDLIFGRDGDDELHGDDPDADRDDDDIDVIFGGNGLDTIHGYNGGLLSIGDANDPDFELMLGNVVFGGDDNDTIDTLDGIDLIFCGAGDDVAQAGKGYVLQIDDTFSIDLGDLMFGQTGNDTLHGDAPDRPDNGDDDGIDVIFGGTGNDGIYGGSGGAIELPDQNFCLIFGNLLFGGPDDDAIRGDYLNWDTNDLEGGIDLIFGAGGNDTIEGSAGSLIIIGDITTGQAIVIAFGNLLFGGPGNDIIRGADAPVACTGVSEDLDDLLDSLGITDLGGAADLIFCSGGDDEVDAYNGIDFVFGSDGEDTLRADNGGFVIVPISGVPTPIALGNIMFGGDDNDIIRSLGRVGLISVPPFEIDLLFGNRCDDDISAGDGMNLVFGNRADDTIVAGDGINLLFGNRGVDNITAGTGLNIAFGNREDDTIVADDGVNILFGNRGNDSVTGGNGLNVAFGNKDNDVVQGGNGVNVLFGNSGRDQVQGGAGLSVLFGNRGDDEVSAGSGLAVLFGNAGNDEVAGANGLCVAFGNADNDIVTAGAGLNVLFGNKNDDRLLSGSGLSVLFGNRDNDIVQAGGSGLYIAFGNADQDVIVGGGGLNLLFGNAGDDQFFGGGGVNIEFGNRENDIMRGGGSSDFLFGNRGGDTISGGGAKDFLFGNRDNDSIVTDNAGDFAFGNRGNDTVRSGGDGSSKDYLFGNRGDDALYGCSNADKLYGGRGSDSKDRNDCNGLTLSPPARGEIRGTVLIDINGDATGDIPHAGVTVTVGSSSAVTDADGRYRIAGLAVGSYTLFENVPGGYMQISSPTTYPITINAMGIDLYQDRDFVNREGCFISPDAWECLGSGCNPMQPGCQPVAVQQVLRCPDTGEICNDASDCPCSECQPSWAVVECECNPECYIILDPATGPLCSTCPNNDGTVQVCELGEQDGIYRCTCPETGCPTDLSQFHFSGSVTSVSNLGAAPPPWNTITPGASWNVTYWFARSTPDQNPDPTLGDYPAMLAYQLQVGPAFSSGLLTPSSTLIRNSSMYLNQYDSYDATWPLSAINSTVLVQLRNFNQTAWTLAGLNPRDSLPLCPDIVLERLERRIFRVEGPPNSAGSWLIIGTIDGFECIDCAPELPPFGKPIKEPATSLGGQLQVTPDSPTRIQLPARTELKRR
ncbi:MAG: PEP-CTERM sorting domain-containing protein [Phycisphaerales bacterium]|nr:PEP-CTERM sorting domain-containing protein [Phycisphaerales bacterium]MCB9863224.1 PEP-CTERM sorting domain-containing protein [Phycisphaerales bacterium]